MSDAEPDARDAPAPRSPSEVLADGGEPAPRSVDEAGEAEEAGYDATRAQLTTALVVAAGLVTLIAGTVVTLSAGGCISPRSVPAFGYSCAGVITEPWFAIVSLITVAAAAVGTVLAVRDLV